MSNTLVIMQVLGFDHGKKQYLKKSEAVIE